MRSSSSSAPDASFAAFLARSLTLLARELPWGYAAMSRALGRRTVTIEVDGEPCGVLCDGASVRLAGLATIQPDVECRTTRRAIHDLVDARTTLAEAVVEDRVFLRGDVDDLLAFHDGLMGYLGGAVRSPGFVWLLREFRAASMGEEGA